MVSANPTSLGEPVEIGDSTVSVLFSIGATNLTFIFVELQYRTC